jgi:NitT/TauT family transport system substrate-binding protein
MFLERADFAQQAYVFSEPFVARQQGSDPRCLMLSEIGFNPYTSVLVVREQLIAEEPAWVGRMVRACVRGWQRYLADPQPANERIAQRNREMSREILAYGAAEIRPLCLPAGMDPRHVGRMTADRWEHLASQLVEIQLLDRRDVWRSAFDVAFLTGNP